MEPIDDGSLVLILPPDARNARAASSRRRCLVLRWSLFDVDDLVDLRLLMDVVFHAVIVLSKGPVTLSIRPVEGTLCLEMRAASHGTVRWTDPDLELAWRWISSTCATAAFGDADGVVWFEAQLQAMSGQAGETPKRSGGGELGRRGEQLACEPSPDDSVRFVGRRAGRGLAGFDDPLILGTGTGGALRGLVVQVLLVRPLGRVPVRCRSLRVLTVHHEPHDDDQRQQRSTDGYGCAHRAQR